MAEDRKKVWPKVQHDFTMFLGCESRSATVSAMFQNQMLVLQQMNNAQAKDCLRAMGKSRPQMAKEIVNWSAAFSTNVLSAQAELMEALESTPWKPWKQNYGAEMSSEDLRELQCELVDVLCFLLNLWALTGGTGAEFFALHKAKCAENERRQKEGY